MPVLGSGHPQADVFLLKYAPTPAEVEEGVAFYGRAGTRADEVAQAAADRPAGRLRHAVREVPGRRPVAGRPGVHRAAWSRSWRSCSRRSSWSWATDALTALNDLDVPLARRPLEPRRASVQQLTPSIDALVRAEHRRARSTRRPPSAPSGRRSGCWASGTRTCRRTRPARRVAGPAVARPSCRSGTGRRGRSLVACAVGVGVNAYVVAPRPGDAMIESPRAGCASRSARSELSSPRSTGRRRSARRRRRSRRRSRRSGIVRAPGCGTGAGDRRCRCSSRRSLVIGAQAGRGGLRHRRRRTWPGDPLRCELPDCGAPARSPAEAPGGSPTRSSSALLAAYAAALRPRLRRDGAAVSWRRRRSSEGRASTTASPAALLASSTSGSRM